ncbi:hypothetical protein AYK24_04520 [Thermoplasmatales archaeon SG8-52-4]|nr:MAG: hypothetical protein AYK24_04520 [Thermoplasmatales archaeon SG8-52-4]
MVKKIIVIFICTLLIITTIPTISGNISVLDKQVKSNPIFNNSEIIFEDDFNDNTKNFSKWTELFTEGEWWERNQRTEFRLYETTHYSYEGINSSEFTASFSSTEGINILADMITDIEHSPGQYVGGPHIKITNGTNYIDISYSRHFDETRIKDSKGTYIVLNYNKPDGDWINQIKIFSDRYKVRMDSDDSGWIYESIFPSNPTLTIRLYIQLAGDHPNLYWIAGFDNIKIETTTFENQPPISDFTWNPEYPKTEEKVLFDGSASYDPDGFIESYEWDFGDGNIGNGMIISHKYYDAGVYNVTLTIKDDGGCEDFITKAIVVKSNQPPNAPIINGPLYGRPDTVYNYIFTSEDPDNDELYYEILWGDGTYEEWLGPYPSNKLVIVNHSWSGNGKYIIMARAKDDSNSIGQWAELEIMMFKGKSLSSSLLFRFLERYPILKILFQRLSIN